MHYDHQHYQPHGWKHEPNQAESIDTFGTILPNIHTSTLAITPQITVISHEEKSPIS
jgi:hypothetical protein